MQKLPEADAARASASSAGMNSYRHTLPPLVLFVVMASTSILSGAGSLQDVSQVHISLA
eukprot:c1574_g1_i1 orf=104-280(+)